MKISVIDSQIGWNVPKAASIVGARERIIPVNKARKLIAGPSRTGCGQARQKGIIELLVTNLGQAITRKSHEWCSRIVWEVNNRLDI